MYIYIYADCHQLWVDEWVQGNWLREKMFFSLTSNHPMFDWCAPK